MLGLDALQKVMECLVWAPARCADIVRAGDPILLCLTLVSKSNAGWICSTSLGLLLLNIGSSGIQCKS